MAAHRRRPPRAGRFRRRTWIAAGLGGVGAAALAAYLLAPGAGAGGPADPSDAELVALGERVYAERCASCHGANLEGQPDWRRPLPTGGLPAPPHDETGHTWHHPDRLLFGIVEQGGRAYAPADFQSNMPAFGGVLSDREIWAALAYIKSRWPPTIRARQERINAAAR